MRVGRPLTHADVKGAVTGGLEEILAQSPLRGRAHLLGVGHRLIHCIVADTFEADQVGDAGGHVPHTGLRRVNIVADADSLFGAQPLATGSQVLLVPLLGRRLPRILRKCCHVLLPPS